MRNLQDAALQDYLATDQARHAVQLMLLADVANGYYRLRELDERITLADRIGRPATQRHFASLRAASRSAPLRVST